MSNLAETNLFKPIKVGNVILDNRIVYAPTTRLRATSDHIPTDSNLEYYDKRSKNNGGLIIYEATGANLKFGFYPNQALIDNEKQINSFKKIVNKIHENGSFVSLQLNHVGRAFNPKIANESKLPVVGPSAIYIDKNNENEFKEQGIELKELTKDEIKEIIKEFVEATKKAINECGFDFVEIHAAHMYLIDQFIQTSSNQRNDEYGGSIENRSRFLFEIIDACIESVGADRIGIRLSPYVEFQGGLGIKSDINPIVIWGYILSELQKRANDGKKLAYVSLVEPRIQGDADGKNSDEANQIDFSWPRSLWKGVILRTGALLDEKHIANLKDFVNSDDKLLIGASRYYTSNPDLVNRLKNGYPLTKYDRPTFYKIFSNEGYLNFQSYGIPEDHSKDQIMPKALA